MCGICGLIGRSQTAPVNETQLRAMCRLLSHRGPDGEGVHLEGNVGLGHRRLRVIDLATGDQPIYNEDRSVAIVFNGEIYNFHELRKDLESRGHRFRTRSDTETIVHLYEEKGLDCLADLRGMFSFAIWDAPRRRLFAAIDRIGKKPFYYAEHKNVLRFGSELKTLLVDPEFPRELDPASLDYYISYQYVPAPRTIFKHAHKLPAAHALTWSDGDLKVWRYWDIDYEPKTPMTTDEAVEAARAQIDEVVRLRLESDVPLGVFLSGGVDSSLVVSTMRRHVAGPLRTFSIGFEEEAFNELPYARRVAERFETEHVEFVLKPNALEVLPRLVWHFDEPMADPAALPTWYLSEMTRRHVTVALNGDGGDESFAGYTRYRGMELFPWYRAYNRIPRFLRRAVCGPAFGALRLAMPDSPRIAALDHLNWISLQDAARRYVLLLSIFRDDVKAWLYGDDFARRIAGHDTAALMTDPYRSAPAREEVDRRMFADIRTYLPGALLPKVDRTTMAFGLEGRSPLLDHKLMEFAARLPAEVKFPDGELKALLKKVAALDMPAEWLERPKQGFGVPIGHWFRGDFRKWAREILTSPEALARGFFDPRRLDLLLKQHESERVNHSTRLWALASLEVWCRTFLDRAEANAPIEL
ncbi:asparagine synthase (glutamine-hydrolyzing) [Candidatus Sumerlaeota bacterium]|nr:asparagine synthase (glutamine-hydrolyzing) [Candidatus Sumerlaeota bacterium]